jgi:regulatory protein
MQSDRLRQAKVRLAKYCAFAERSPRQVREKLNKYGISGAGSEQIIEELRQDNFMNSERFARAFCNDKFEFNSWGKKKIEIELRQHDIESHWIEVGLEAIDRSKYEIRINELLFKKWKSLKTDEEYLTRKKKTIDYVIRKGFEPGLVFELFDKSFSKK